MNFLTHTPTPTEVLQQFPINLGIVVPFHLFHSLSRVHWFFLLLHFPISVETSFLVLTMYHIPKSMNWYKFETALMLKIIHRIINCNCTPKPYLNIVVCRIFISMYTFSSPINEAKWRRNRSINSWNIYSTTSYTPRCYANLKIADWISWNHITRKIECFVRVKSTTISSVKW